MKTTSGYAKLLQSLDSWTADTAAGLFYVDMCHLRAVNRLASPIVADELVNNVARHLKSWAGRDGFSARLWSDEFIAIKPLDHAQQAAEEAKQLRDLLTSITYTGSHGTSTLSVSIGVVPLPVAPQWPSLLTQAEDACDAAKQRGINQIFFSTGGPKPQRPSTSGSDSVTEFRRLLGDNSLMLHPQPIMAIGGAQPFIAKAEFLLRVERQGVWMPPPRGMIEAMESYGLSTELDQFSSRYLLDWLEENRRVLDRLDGVSINLSARSFVDGLFMGKLFDEVRHARLPPGKLVLEITETAAIEHLDVAAEVIADFKTLGVRFSLDDFGSGLCSFGYLHSLPVDEVKIDGRFIRELATSPVSEKIVRAIYQVARATGKTIVAEFVDDARKLAVLQDIGFDYAQGWLFYPSVTPEKLLDLVMTQQELAVA